MTIKNIIFDFSRVLLFPRDDIYAGTLSKLAAKHKKEINEKLVLNRPLLNFLHDKKGKYHYFIFTASRGLVNFPPIKKELTPLFIEVFTSKDIGPKDVPASYLKILSKTKAQPTETLFVDDTPINVAAAENAGLKTILFKSNDDFMKKLRELTSESQIKKHI